MASTAIFPAVHETRCIVGDIIDGARIFGEFFDNFLDLFPYFSTVLISGFPLYVLDQTRVVNKIVYILLLRSQLLASK